MRQANPTHNGQGVGSLGDAEPKFQMSTYNDITWNKRLSLRFLIHWKYGGQNVNVTSLQSVFGGTSADFDKPTKSGMPYGITQLMQIGVNAQQTVETSSYLRFREIGLYYAIRKLPVAFIKSINVGASLHNFFTITKYNGMDPEIGHNDWFSSGIDLGYYPRPRTMMIGANIRF